MKLFDDFEAIKFSQENLVFVTSDRYLYYIYDPESKYWRKYKNAGYDRITVENYQDVSKEEIINAMDGVFPQKETDLMRKCLPSQLCISDMMDLLEEDYTDYMTDHSVCHRVHTLLLESERCSKSFEELRRLFDNAVELQQDNNQVTARIEKLSYAITGRDIFKEEIGIVDGHDSSSYFWIMPSRIIDYSDTAEWDNVAKMTSAEISIEENDVYEYLTPFIYRYYDDELEANKNRIEFRWTDEDGNIQTERVCGFEWYLEDNYFTFDSIREMLKDIRDTADALSFGRENEYTAKLKEKGGTASCDMIVDFYCRFIYRMEYMLTVGGENGYNLISFMGP